MRFNAIFILLISMLAQSEERDPFKPVAQQNCQTLTASLHGWQLRGTLGAGGKFTGWLLSPQGEWLQCKVGDELGEGWRVTSMTNTTMTVSSTRHCNSLQHTFFLKGNMHGKDAAVAVAGNTATARE